MKLWIRKRLPLLIGLTVTLLPLAAQAQRKSPLADAPAIRKRLELRDTRLEFGAGLGTTLNQDFYHTAFANIRLGFHFTDWLSIAGFADFAVANISTGLRDRVLETLMDPPTAPRQPTNAQASAAMSQINQMFGGQLEFTPFTGKYSLFGKLFAHYDFYLSAGGGAINVAPTNANVAPCSPTTMFGDCPVSGVRPGFVVGAGMHSFFNQWLAVNVELRDIIASLNPAGRDVNGDGVANSADQTLSNTFSVIASLVVYLPTVADISP